MAGKKPPEFHVVCRLSSSELEPARISGIFFRPSCFLDLFVCAMLIRLFRAVAGFFVTSGGGAHYRECQRHEPCRGSGGILPQSIFKFEGSETLFLALVMRYVS